MNRQLERPDVRSRSNNTTQSEAKNKYKRDQSHRRTLRNTHKNLFSDGSTRNLKSDTSSKGNFSILSRPVMAECANPTMLENLSKEKKSDSESPNRPTALKAKIYSNNLTNQLANKRTDDIPRAASANTPDRKKETLTEAYTPEQAFSYASPESTLKRGISSDFKHPSSVNSIYKSPTPIVRLLKSSPIAKCQSPSMPNLIDRKRAFRFPRQSIKLVNAQLNVATDLYSCLGTCLGATDLMIVGVLGLDGAGKSTIASILAGELAELGSDQVTDVVTDKNDVESVGVSCKVISKNSISLEQRKSRGIDLLLSSGTDDTPGNIILLDTEPILSSHHLAEMSLTNKNSKSQDDTKHTSKAGTLYQRISLQKIEANSIQQAVFLFSVSHYVVFVYDDLSDFSILKDFIHRVDLSLQQVHASNRLADCKLSGQNRLDDSFHVAKLLFIANRLDAHSIPSNLHQFDQLRCIAVHGNSLSENDQHPSTPQSSVLFLPELQSSNNSEVDRFRLDPLCEFERKAAHLRQFVQSLPINSVVNQSNSISDTKTEDSSTDSKHQGRRRVVKQTDNEFMAQTMSLKEWLKVACRVYECVRSSKDWRPSDKNPKKSMDNR